ncbi:putative T7SS-secreted protein [Streptomyces hainanensis]|uniref:Putative T7SS secretion signal domain-containing protein n=1 Tax=Streptomyces hainanensis TaxID=402648 RepID=A0A4R4T8M5_9ACTN|nr:hypothetical protein [Streptomyces hainanensis]TDC73420.1 hypothetical protein E1283_19225 [Streptomyces hainanensis]
MAEYPHLGFDPCPGDVTIADALAGTMREVTARSSSTHTTLTSINTTDGIWVGRAADAFGDAFSEVPPQLDRAVTAMDVAARALSGWAGELAGFQARARALEEEAASAQAAADAARVAVDGMPTDTAGMTDDERGRHEDDAERAGNRLSTANAGLAAIRSRAEGLNAEFVSAADDTARQLRRAGESAPPEPDLLDRIGSALEDIGDFLADVIEFLADPAVWRAIGDLFSNIAMVLGTLCMIIMLFSNPAGWLVMAALVASTLALGFHVAAKAGGEDIGWDTIVCDAVGVLGGALGVGAGRVVAAGRAGVAAGQGMRAAGFAQAVGGPGRLAGLGQWFRGVGVTMRGWSLVGVGNGLNWTGTVGGNGAAYTDLGRNFSVPFLAPFSTLGDLWSQHSGDGGQANAARFSPPQRLTAASDAFANGLEQDGLVTAA